MTKKSGRKSIRAPRVPAPPRLKIVRPMSWYGGYVRYSAGDYLSHLMRELGRLGLEVSDIDRHDRPPNTKAVLSDLMNWLSARPAEAFARLFDWRALDIELMRSRLSSNRDSKPRIEVSAQITKMNNLSVRWHPGGWRQAEFDWDAAGRSHFNLIPQRKWKRPPDFHWFTGDEDPYFDSRPSNELMYIRGVGNLRPQPREEYGPYATYNSDVVDSILVCAVRSAYENLVHELERSFDVDVIDAFDFVIRDEIDETDQMFRSSTHRVVDWTVEDATQLKARREREAADEREKKDRAEFANISATYGFSVVTFVEALTRACSKKSTGPAPSAENSNRNAAKDLRSAGFNVNAGSVRRIRHLIERYGPEALPESLRPQPVAAPSAQAPPNNIFPFPGTET